MAKRGRKPKNPSLLQSVDAKVMREIIGLVVALLALIMVLAIFDAAGSIGRSVFDFFSSLIGPVAYMVPFWIMLFSLMLFEVKVFNRDKAVFWGFLGFILLFSALIAPFNNSGGAIGGAIFTTLENGVGMIASFIILVLGSIVSLLIIFNLSLTEMLSKIKIPTSGTRSRDDQGASVKVFRAVRRTIGMGRDKKHSKEASAPIASASADSNWVLPETSLLTASTGEAKPGNVNKNMDILVKTLNDFGVEVEGGKINIGPTVTQFEIRPSEGVKLNTIKARADDLALALAMHPVRVEAPIPGKSAVGVEVPNHEPATVALKQILESDEFIKRKSNLSIPLGMDVAGETIVADLKSMPHLLVAGATGSGKSVGLNSVLISLLFQNSPRDLRLLLVDPKRVEFTAYNGIPHLLTPVVVDVDKTVNLLRWTISEMERRFRLFEDMGSRDIESYNEKVKKSPQKKSAEIGEGEDQEEVRHEKLPYIVLVIDELADLMAQASNEVEGAIVRLAQLARATGIHLIVATQRPSVDVITGIIKANITSRVAFAVASQVDSRTIIDQSGAEKLLGNGDMLFLGGKFSKPKRIQGAFTSEKDVHAVTDFLKSEGSAIYDQTITEYREVSSLKSRKTSISGDDDPLLKEAIKEVIEQGSASASYLQRRLKVGYARAARILDLMEEKGVIGPQQGAKPRDVLITSLEEEEESADL